MATVKNQVRKAHKPHNPPRPSINRYAFAGMVATFQPINFKIPKYGKFQYSPYLVVL